MIRLKTYLQELTEHLMENTNKPPKLASKIPLVNLILKSKPQVSRDLIYYQFAKLIKIST